MDLAGVEVARRGDDASRTLRARDVFREPRGLRGRSYAAGGRTWDASVPRSTPRDVEPVATSWVPYPGQFLGAGCRYQVCSAIGRGGTATVLLAFDRERRTHVALKVRSEEEFTAQSPLRKEYALLQRLEHPGIVKASGYDDQHGVEYLAMQYVRGTTLDHLIQRRRFSASSALSTVLLLACAVQHAHQRGVLHLDLKPNNVMVDADGTPTLVDFGAGRTMNAMSAACDGDAQQVVGTPHYMAPEQWSGERVDERTDVWGLGMILLEMLCGATNTARSGSVSYLGFALERPKLSSERQLPDSVLAICERCLARGAADRFPSVSSLCETVRESLAGALVG